MEQFAYEAITLKGESRVGSLEATSLADAVAQIESQGMKVTSIQPHLKPTIPTGSSGRERPEYLRRIDQAVSDSVPVALALEVAGRELLGKNSPALRNVIDSMRRPAQAEEFIHNGALAEVLPMVLSFLAAKEDGSALPYQMVLDYVRRQRLKRGNRWRAIAYPLLCLFIGIVILVLVSVTVVPIFSKIMREFELRIPAPTWLFINISDGLLLHPWKTIGLGLLVLIVTILVAIGMARIWTYLQSTWLLGGLVAGSRSNLNAMSRFTRTLAELIQLEAPLPDAIRIAGVSCQQYHLRKKAQWFAKDLDALSDPWTASRVVHCLPPTVRFALRETAKGRSCAQLLRQISQMYEDRAEQRAELTGSLAGPVSIIFVGILVGFIVLALFLPFISLLNILHS